MSASDQLYPDQKDTGNFVNTLRLYRLIGIFYSLISLPPFFITLSLALEIDFAFSLPVILLILLALATTFLYTLINFLMIFIRVSVIPVVILSVMECLYILSVLGILFTVSTEFISISFLDFLLITFILSGAAVVLSEAVIVLKHDGIRRYMDKRYVMNAETRKGEPTESK